MEKRPTQGWSNCLADIVWSISKLDIQAGLGARLIHRNTKVIQKEYKRNIKALYPGWTRWFETHTQKYNSWVFFRYLLIAWKIKI